jgi:hypothetical protein
MCERNPLYTTQEGFLIFEDLVKETKTIIDDNDNSRIIVIQTWLIIDFCIREILITGLNLSDFVIDDLDLRDYLLPRAFDSRMKLIKKIKRTQKSLKAKSFDPRIGWPFRFLKLMKEDNPEFYSKLMKYEQDYYKKFHPECVEKPGSIYMPNLDYDIITNKKINYRSVTDEWLEAAEKIDDDWIKMAKRINRARNKAAHSFDCDIIYETLDLKGKDKLLRLKEECKKILNDLLDMNNI